MRHPRIPAFTVAELMVAMLLTILVVGFGYAALDIVGRRLGQQTADTQQLLEGNSWAVFLRRDFAQARFARLEGRRLVLESPQQEVEYHLQAGRMSRIVRVAGEMQKDGTAIPFRLETASFLGHPASNGFIDHCTFTYQILGKGHTLSLYKEYSSDDLLRIANHSTRDK